MLAAAQRAVGRPIAHEIVGRQGGDTVSVFADPSGAAQALAWKAGRTLDDMCSDHRRWQSRHPWGFGRDTADEGFAPAARDERSADDKLTDRGGALRQG